MKYKILELEPDLMFIKKNPTGLYDVYINYEWSFFHDKITFFRDRDITYPRKFKVHCTYNQAKNILRRYLGSLDTQLANGAKIIKT